MADLIGYTVRAVLFLFVRLYQKALSPLLPPSCRFVPSCSHYALEVLQTWPLLPGMWLIAKRLVRCQPLCSAGLDPVPPYPGHPGHRNLSGAWLGLASCDSTTPWKNVGLPSSSSPSRSFFCFSRALTSTKSASSARTRNSDSKPPRAN